MKSIFLVAYAVAIPALCSYALYRAARLWMWAAPILATVAGAVVVSVYLGGVPLPGEEAGMTYWTLLMPIQQLIAISICLGALVGMRWGGSLGLAVGGAGVVLGLMLLAVTGLPFLLFPACLLLYGAVLLLSFTGRARKAWEEYRQGNTPEL